MKLVEQNADVGVIVGRFQSPVLHDGYLEVITTVANAHPRVIIYLGLSPLKFTKKNPLDYGCRRAMIEERFPGVEVYYIDDVGNNEKWSRKLDEQIRKAVGPDLKVVLYGSRDSFINSYTGKYPTVELVPSKIVSATEYRKAAGIKALKSADFRMGIVHAVENQDVKVVPAVDLAIIDYDKKQLLLARKPNEDFLRFVGGKIDAEKDKSAEGACVREGKEETGLDLTVEGYVGSALVDDWKYRSERDKIMAWLYVMRYTGGNPEAMDDIEYVTWKKFGEISEADLMPVHRPLLLMLNDYFKNEILRLA